MLLNINNPSFESVSSKEWIVTNGIGGYASSSICGANTRRYHGLLVASFNPPTDRCVIISKVEETITVDGEEFQISSNQYPDVVHPHGYQWLKSFHRSSLPCAAFTSPKFSIHKTVFMIYGSNTTVIEYANKGDSSFHLSLTPLCVYRDYHHLFRENNEFDFLCQHDGHGKLTVTPKPGISPFYIYMTGRMFKAKRDWYRNFEYNQEKERGLDFSEDAFCIGEIEYDLAPGDKKYLIMTTDHHLPDGTPASWKAYEKLRLRELVNGVEDTFLHDLIISGDQFLVWRLSSRSHSLIAGYHWFTDWGRDTMIAMRGLIIATGKKQIAESIFRTFLKYLSEGMIPNRFPDEGEEPEYNTIDATLWLFVALYDYYEKFNDTEFIRSVFSSLTDILEAHDAGTRYHIHVTPEGLLFGGEEKTQLTWMDAKVGDHVVTPRQGCAVEINALFYNALRIYSFLGRELKMNVDDYESKAKQTLSSFRKYFINAAGYLNDLVIPGKMTDASLRPNQVYAISLPFPMLEGKEARKVLQFITEHLYTDFGLRSLSPLHRDFKPIYTGDQWHRDHAYHQGTVWGFLWGEYALAYLSVNKYSDDAKRYIRKKSEALRHHFYNEDGLHAISEIFDGANPTAGKGCIQQAWSVGNLIKVLQSI